MILFSCYDIFLRLCLVDGAIKGEKPYYSQKDHNSCFTYFISFFS
jgi:hypothetical protein